MSINYFNSIKIDEIEIWEKPLSLTKRLEKWGNQLISPMQSEFGGRNYVVCLDPELKQVKITEENKKSIANTTTNKIAAFIGCLFKRIAVLFDSEIHTRHLLIAEKENQEAMTRHINLLLKKTYLDEKEAVKGEGYDNSVGDLLQCLCAIYEVCSRLI